MFHSRSARMPRPESMNCRIAMPSSVLTGLREQIELCPLQRRPALLRRWHGLQQRMHQGKPHDRGLQQLEEAIQQAVAWREARVASLPKPEYPLALPVVARREELRAVIERHPVVIVCGETGSGKTTQLPKICLELGRGVDGLIGHTQPRRIAARSLAARVAEELHSRVGEAVGCKMRFHDQVGEQTFLKIMTDGILLAETQSDPDLLQYDTLILDEAHERSLNIDFLLGYLKQLLPRRPDLKLIITSATIDPQRFARHFSDAPVIEVSGRTYPVEIRYRPLLSEDEEQQDRDRGQALLDAVDELAREGDGDVLVFLPGERDIREAAELLRKHHPPHTEVLPLYARLSTAQQQAIFRPHKGRRIVLATNVAETSLTVPGIRYVVDTGLARISRYSYRNKVQRLPIEKISQASANQRAGRCGRVAEGICIRLYSEEDFAAREPFTDPEILRTNLAAVILQMMALKLGTVEKFPFVDPPDPRVVRDGFKLLHELGAVDTRQQVTEQGRQLARLPVDPRIGRMVLAARDEGCLREVLIIAAALSVQDPRDRPMDKAQAADEKHRLFADEQSDFLGYRNLWDAYHEQARHLSQNKLRKWCQVHFISYVRMREWHEVERQLQRLVTEMGMRLNQQEADYDAIHRALLSGLLGNLALKSEEREYLGARNLKLELFPGSVLVKKRPQWVMAAELVETGKRYARTLAAIQPQWVEPLAGDLVKRSYSEPHWQKRAGQVSAYERVTLYGLPIVSKRRVNYGPIDPVLSRELFIREALVEGQLDTPGRFLAHNRGLVEEVLELEAKSRRRDLLVSEEDLFAFYDERIPTDIYNRPRFERWRKRVERDDPRCLYFDRALLLQASEVVDEAQFPARLVVQGLPLSVQYCFEPGQENDGMTVTVPLAGLNQLCPDAFEWVVPGLLEEKLTLLIKSLPKGLRRNFVPAPDFARACLKVLLPGETSLLPVLTEQLQRMTGVTVPEDAWRPEQLPPHLFARFQVVDAQGRPLAAGRDLTALQHRFGNQARDSFRSLPSNRWERGEVSQWDFDALPEFVELEQAGVKVRGYPALVVQEQKIALRLLDASQEARYRHRAGVLALLRKSCARSVKHVQRNLPGIDAMCLRFAPVGSCSELKEDLLCAVLAQSFLADREVPRSRDEFEACLQQGEPQLMGVANELCGWLAPALEEYHQLGRLLKGKLTPAHLAVAAELREQLDELVYPGFVLATAYAWMPHLARFLKAMRLRWEKLPANPGRDRQQALVVAPLAQRSRQAFANLPKFTAPAPALLEYRWWVEELRVSLFAQELKTSVKVSPERLERAWRAL